MPRKITKTYSFFEKSKRIVLEKMEELEDWEIYDKIIWVCSILTIKQLLLCYLSTAGYLLEKQECFCDTVVY